MADRRWQQIQQGFLVSTPQEQWLLDTWARAAQGAQELAAQIRARLFPEAPPAPVRPSAPGGSWPPPWAIQRWQAFQQGFLNRPSPRQMLLDAMRRWLGG